MWEKLGRPGEATVGTSLSRFRAAWLARGRGGCEHHDRKDAVVDALLLAAGGHAYRPQSRGINLGRPRTICAVG